MYPLETHFILDADDGIRVTLESTEKPDRQSEREIYGLVATLIARIGEEDFCASLAPVLQRCATFNSFVVLAYHYRYAPRVVYQAMAPEDAAALHGRYFTDAYLLSPFYLRWRAEPDASRLYRLLEITPEGFFESAYFVDYYARSGLCDEYGYVIPTGEEAAVLVSMGRTESLGPFPESERTRLLDVEPLIVSSVKRHFSLIQVPAGRALRRHLDDTLGSFGRRELTEREQAVVQLMLRGHSSKSCARALGISHATERVHRRNIYTKLGISSQAELFTLFFNRVAPGSSERADAGPGDPGSGPE